MEGLNTLDTIAQMIAVAVLIAVIVAITKMAKRSDGQGAGPLFGVAIGAATFGWAVWNLWDDRVWHELLTETSSPVVQLLPPGVICESCRWEGYDVAMATSTKSLLMGGVIAIVFIAAAWRYRLRAVRSKQLEHARFWISLEIALIMMPILALIVVVQPPSGRPKWESCGSSCWVALQTNELMDKHATSAACALFWSKFSSRQYNTTRNAVMPSGQTLDTMVSSLSSRCLVEAPPEKPPTFAFFASVAWNSATTAAQETWLKRRTERVDPCDALATPEVQCVLARRDPAHWKEDAARCLKDRGCYPYRGETNVVTNILTLGLLGNKSDSCEPHKKYLKDLVESDREGPKVPDCDGP